MKILSKGMFLSIIVSVALVGCGGGGGGGTPAISGGTAGTGGGSGTTFGTNYIFYIDGEKKLQAFDPDTKTSTQVSVGAIDFTQSITTGDFEKTTNTITNLRTDRQFFAESGVYKSVSPRKSDTLSLQRHTNYSYTGMPCGPNSSSNVITLTDSGPDGLCGIGGDDSGFYSVSLNMSSTDSPIDLSSRPVSVLFLDDTNTLSGFLVVQGGNLVRLDAKGLSPIILQSAVIKAENLYAFGDEVVLNIDGVIKTYNKVTNALSSWHTLVDEVGFAVVSNDQFYFFDGGSLYEASFGSTAAAVLIGTDSGPGRYDANFIDSGKMIYFRHDGVGSQIKEISAMDISDGSIANLVNDSFGSIRFSGRNGSRVFYNISNNATQTYLAGMVLTDNSSNLTITDASWSGTYVDDTIILDEGVNYKYIALSKHTYDTSVFGTINGGTISIYDAASYTEKSVQGAFPSGFVGFSGNRVNETTLMVGIFNNATDIDVVYLNPEIDNSIDFIAATPGVLEIPAF